MGEKVSIVIPIYNQQKYLDKAIKSVMNQSYENIEIICVNDGSTDDSEDIIKKYQKEDVRIKLVNKHNGGLIDATIVGTQSATGKYICFVDSDDIVGGDYVSTYMEYIGTNDFVAMGYWEKRDDDIFDRPLRNDSILNKNDLEQLKSCFLYNYDYTGISNVVFISRCNKLYKTSLVKSILSDYEECRNVSLGEDSIFTYLILCNANSGRTLAKPNSYYYNVSSVSSMMNTTDIYTRIEKARMASETLALFISKYGGEKEQAACLFYFLTSLIQNEARLHTSKELEYAYRILHKDIRFNKGYVLTEQRTIKKIINRVMWNIPNQKLYCAINIFLCKVKKRWNGIYKQN